MPKSTQSIAMPDESRLTMRIPAPTPLSEKSIDRLRAVGRAFGEAKDKRVSGRISAELLAAAKHRLGATSDTEAIEMALANMVVTDDFGTWLVDQAGQLDQDFELGL
jgi:hypothetical protein